MQSAVESELKTILKNIPGYPGLFQADANRIFGWCMIEWLNMLMPGERLLYSIMAGGALLLPFALWKWVFGNKNFLQFRKRPNSFSPFDFILLLIVWLSLNMILGQFTGLVAEGNKTVFKVAAILATQLLVFPLELYMCKRRFSGAAGEGGLGLTASHLYSDVFLALACVIIVLPVCQVMAGAMTDLLKFFPSYHPQEHVLLKNLMNVGIGGKILIILSATVGAPLFEELFFRGILQSMLRRVLSPWFSIFITSIFFIIVHMEIQNWPSLLLLSMTLGFVYEKTGRITLPIIIHSVFNATYITAYLLGVPQAL